MDLRTRALAAVDGGMNRRAAAKRFGVGVSSVIRWNAARCATGAFAPKAQRRDLLWPASLRALAACALVLVVGAFAHRPLSRVPENTLKFGVGVMLSAFGVSWTGEGLGVEWPGQDLALVVFAVVFLLAGLMSAALARATIREVAQ